MSLNDKQVEKAARAARMETWLAARSSRNKSLLDKLCRFLISRAMKPKADEDFLRDPFVDNDQGFDPEELDRFQRGE